MRDINDFFEDEGGLACEFGANLPVCPIEDAKRIAVDYAEQFKPKWIPCSEQLPFRDGDSSVYCLVKSKQDGIVVRPYNEYHKCWDQEDGDDHYCEAVGGWVTDWMPLPDA